MHFFTKQLPAILTILPHYNIYRYQLQHCIPVSIYESMKNQVQVNIICILIIIILMSLLWQYIFCSSYTILSPSCLRVSAQIRLLSGSPPSNICGKRTFIFEYIDDKSDGQSKQETYCIIHTTFIFLLSLNEKKS